MPISPDKPAPCAPYVEDCDDSQDEKDKSRPGPPVANSARKVTRRDEASDSGYSSHTYATGSSSQSSHKKVPEPKKTAESKSVGGFFSKFGMGKKSSQSTSKKRDERAADKPESPKAVRRHSLGRASRNQDLRAAAAAVAETKDVSIKKRPVIAPVDTKLVRTESAHATVPVPANLPRASPVLAYGPQLISVPQPDQRVYHSAGRPRPYSYHGGSLPAFGPPGAAYYPDARPPPMPMMMPPGVHAYPAPGTGQPPYAVLQPSSPTNRIINYNIPHTSPPVYMGPTGSSWGNLYPPPPLRRVSMSAATHGPIVQYPRVPPSHYSLQRTYTSEYATPIESPEEYEAAIHTRDDESYYRVMERRARDRRSMPPPPIPQRPGLGRAATTSTTRTMTLPRDKRHSLEPRTLTRIEPRSASPRKASIDESVRPPSRPNPAKRNSQSSAQSGEAAAPATAIAMAPAPPSPTLRRRSHGLSRPTSYQDGHDKYQAAEAYQEQTGVDSQPAITADAVHKVLREKTDTKHSRGTRSTRSQSSRASSKSSDPKRQHRTTASGDRPRERERDHDRNALDAVRMKVGRMVLDAAGGRSFAVHGHDGDIKIRLKSAPQSRSRDGRSEGKEHNTRYIPSSSTNSRGDRGEVEIQRSRIHRKDDEPERSNSSRHRSRSHVRRRPEDSAVVVDGECIERVRSKAESHRESNSRRSSRSGAGSRRPVLREVDS